MSEELAALRSAADDIFGHYCTPDRLAAAEGGIDRQLWDALEASGLTTVGVAEASGGSGGGLAELGVLVEAAGRHLAPVPLAEASLLGGWLFELAGLPRPEGIVTTGLCSARAERRSGGWQVQGTASRVAYARAGEHLAVLAESPQGPMVVRVALADTQISAGANVANEPRDDVRFDLPAGVDDVGPVPVTAGEEFRLRGALSRCLLLAGAAQRVLDETIDYAKVREQFGRPISAFQAIQQTVAVMAAEVAAAGAATRSAVLSAQDSDWSTPTVRLAVGSAKVRTSQAAGVLAAAAHQIHGAIGMTHEHQLRFATTRLWAWRAEWGSEAMWCEEIASAAIGAGADGLWPLLAGA